MALKYCYCGCRNDMKYTEQKMSVWIKVPTQYWFFEVLVIIILQQGCKRNLKCGILKFFFFIESWIEVALVSAFNLATFSCRWYKVMLKEVLRYPYMLLNISWIYFVATNVWFEGAPVPAFKLAALHCLCFLLEVVSKQWLSTLFESFSWHHIAWKRL